MVYISLIVLSAIIILIAVLSSIYIFCRSNDLGWCNNCYNCKCCKHEDDEKVLIDDPLRQYTINIDEITDYDDNYNQRYNFI